jgi:hypothetical protein
MYKKPSKDSYHVFSNTIDEYFIDELSARKCAHFLYKEQGAVRIYHDTVWNSKDGVWEDGDCIYSKGEFPC